MRQGLRYLATFRLCRAIGRGVVEMPEAQREVRLRHTVEFDGDSNTWIHLTTLGTEDDQMLYVAAKTNSRDCTVKDCGAKHKYALMRYIFETHCDRPDLFSRAALSGRYPRVA